MKKYIVLLIFICAGLMATAQTSSIIANTVDARKSLLVPRLATFPAAKPGMVIMKTGADSGYWVSSVTGNSWQKIYPATGGSGTSYTIGNGLKQVGSEIRWADTLLTNTTVNITGSTQLKFVYSSPSSSTPSFLMSGFSMQLQAIDRYANNIILGGGGNAYNQGLALYSSMYGGSAGTEGSSGSSLRLRGDTIRANDGFLSTQYRPIALSLTKYDFWGYDKVSGAFVRIPITLLPSGGDTATTYASKPYVTNAIAAATLQDIPGVVDVQDVQNGGLRATNYINQIYHDSSYLTKRKADELYHGINSETNNRVIGQWYEFISAPASTTGGTNDLAFNGVGSGASAGIAASPAANRPGILTMPTGTTATGRSTLYNHSGMNMLLLGGGAFTAEFEARHVTLYTGTEQYYTQMGLLSGTGADQANAVYVLYDNGGTTTGSTATANYQFVTASSGSRTITTTSVPVVSGTTTDFQRLRIDVTPAGDTARLYINGTLAATHTTNIPRTTPVTIAAQISKYGTGTTSRVLQLDYINWRYRFTTSR